MIINIQGSDLEFDTPQFGYKTSVVMAMDIDIDYSGGIHIWDNSSNYDYRILDCTWLLDKTQFDTMMKYVFGVIDASNTSRIINCTFKLGSNSGFYPFGPDRGDSGDFGCRVISFDQRPSVGHPEDYFNVYASFIFNGSWPVYALPTQTVKEGNLKIGTVASLRYPENMHDLDNKYNYKITLNEDGTPYSMGYGGVANDMKKTVLPLILNQPNAAKLIDYISSTARGASTTIVAPANSYMFGIEHGSTASYSCKILQNQIDIIHDEYNRFSFELSYGF